MVSGRRGGIIFLVLDLKGVTLGSEDSGLLGCQGYVRFLHPLSPQSWKKKLTLAGHF